MNNYIEILRKEFEAEKDSFILKIRIDLKWDKNAFTILYKAMEQCCLTMEKENSIPRWLADGFYTTSTFVKNFTSHNDFPKEFSEEYYKKAYRRLDDLTKWFFTGRRPYMSGFGFDTF